MLLLFLIGIFTLLVYYVFIKPHRYWKNRCALYETPVPLFGNLAPAILQKQSLTELIQDVYNRHENQRYVGIYQFMVPALILRDPELIKQITVKEFDSFPEHRMFASEDADPLWANNLFAMPGGEQWRDVRSVLSPAFTSCKLRAMLALITECAKQFTDYLEKQDGFVTMEMKDTFTRVTNDVIATTAFGVVCNSLKDRDNEFYLMGRDATDITGIKSLKFFVAAISPMLAKFLKIRFISERSSKFFRRVIKEAITFRREMRIVRPDMIHLLMEARKGRSCEEKVVKGKKTEITDDLIAAQALVFFLGGFDTISTAMCYTAYELAINPEIQKRLQKEVDSTMEMCNANLSYEDLQEMKYMDMVVSESLRKWPPIAVTDRKPTKSFIIEPELPGEKPLLLDGDVTCQVPIYAIHRDEKYHPNPNTFDPERFNEINKPNIKPFTYLPFGTGPRSCIGSRFALLELKIIIFYILSKFEIVPVERTQIPLELSKSNVNPLPDEGFWLGLRPRHRNVPSC